jgi:transposase
MYTYGLHRPLFVFIIGFPVNSANLQQHVVMLEQELQWARLKIQALTEELRLERIKRYGHKSETLSALQLELLDEEPGVTSEEVEAEATREPLPAARKRERKPHPGRQILPEHLPRVEQVVACKDRTCQQCGGETTLIGYDKSEHLDMEPVRFFVRVVKREKRGCRQCKTSGVMMAELAPRIVEKGIASDRVVVETVVAKYCDHLPLYRQEAMLQREAGLEISRATLTGWVMRIGELLQPLVGVMRKDLLGASYLQADETVVPVQMHDKRGADHQAYLWQYGRPGGETVFDFRLDRGRAGPKEFLDQWEGILQTDGYSAYDRVGGQRLVHVGCWAHARRKFVDAVKVNQQDGEAVNMVTRMDALFLVDRHAREQKLTADERLAYRREHALAWVAEIHEQCLALSKSILPKSTLGQAVGYTLNLWPKLRRCFDYGEVELSNNLAENSIRPVTLGRKNWLHVGSAQAGPKVAALFSVIESCRRLRVPPKDYLLDVLPRMSRRTRSEYTQLTPARWLSTHR